MTGPETGAPLPPVRIILALPAFNEAENLTPLCTAAGRVFREAGFDYQIIVVNDGSTDNTGEVLAELARELPLSVVNHPQNRGLGAAIQTALESALAAAADGEDIIVNMDADNTHDPAYVVPMVARIRNEGYDVVIASRFCEGSQEVGVPFFRRLMSRGARLVFRVTLRLPEVRDYTCGYRAYRARIIRDAIDKHGGRLITRQGFACTDELLVKLAGVTRRIGEVPFVLRYDRKRGSSKMPLVRTIIETLKLLIFHR